MATRPLNWDYAIGQPHPYQLRHRTRRVKDGEAGRQY